MSTELRHGYCALCISRCGCVATLEDGVLTRVDADPAHPTGRALCVKAKAAAEAVYAPDRILYPLRRTRPKGEPDPGWERISWEVALDLVAAKARAAIAQHGPQGLAFGVATPSGTAVADSFAWIHRLAHACHSPIEAAANLIADNLPLSFFTWTGTCQHSNATSPPYVAACPNPWWNCTPTRRRRAASAKATGSK